MPNHPVPSSQPEEWLTRRLRNVAESDPHFEASLYRPYNAFLSHYFPYQQRFLVTPQTKVREIHPEDGDVSFSSNLAESSLVIDEASFAADPPMTSMGGLAMPGGSTVVPDFIVAKATEFVSHDRVLLLVEIKPRKPDTQSTMKKYEYQMNQYMDFIAEQVPEDAKLVGLLICGTEVTICRLESPRSLCAMDAVRHDISSVTIRELLLNIAKDNWEY